MRELLERVKTDQEEHPYMDEKEVAKIESRLASMEREFKEVKQIVGDQLSERRREIEEQKKNDKLRDLIDGLPTGEPFSHREQMEIMREGEFRYRNSFPPGYKDVDTKKGSQRYGDLFIWKEIIRHASETGKPILFIVDDRKEDWFRDYSDQAGPKAPRHELMKEFMDEAHQDIWFMTLVRYIETLKARYKDTSVLPFYKGIEAVLDSLRRIEAEKKRTRRPASGSIVVKCEECSEIITIPAAEIDWDWELESSDEREMGVENEYVATHYETCPGCDTEIALTFRVWEYPEGAYNNEETECEGGELIESVNLQDYIEFNDYESCVLCGREAELNEFGMCAECEGKISSDE